MRPYTLSKKLLASRYVAILLVSKLPVFKDRYDGADVVGLTRVELVTSSLSGTRSNQLSYKPNLIGGGSRIRTGDMLLAKLPLYQLSYAPGKGPLRLHRKGGGTLDRHGSSRGFQLRHLSGCSLERR